MLRMNSAPLYMESYVSRHLLLRGIATASVFGFLFMVFQAWHHDDPLWSFLFIFGIALIAFISTYHGHDATCVKYFSDRIDISTKRKTVTVTYKELKRVWVGEYRLWGKRELLAQKHPDERQDPADFKGNFQRADLLIWGPGTHYNPRAGLILERHNLNMLFVLRCQDIERVREILRKRAPQVDISGLR